MNEQKARITLKFKKQEKNFYEKMFEGFQQEKYKILALRVTKKKDTQLTLYASEKANNLNENNLPIHTFRKIIPASKNLFSEIKELHMTIEIKE